MQGTTSKPQEKQPVQQNTNQPIPFQAQSLPQDRFPLFEQPDYYICERKFYNTLPKPSVPARVFNYNIFNERFIKLDMPTLMFGLKQNQNILTDSKINTNIHLDFIEKSIDMVLPEMEHLKNDSFLGNKRKVDEKLKNEVLAIIEAEDTKKDNNNKTKESFYLRKSTFVTPSLNVAKKYSQNIEKQEHEIVRKAIKHEEKHIPERSINIKNDIKDTFEKVSQVMENSEHPYKKGVFAKNVYTLKPFLELFNTKFSEIQFDNDPATEVSSYNSNSVKNFLVKFKKNSTLNSKTINLDEDKVVSLYSNNNTNLENEEDDKTFYQYERDYRYNMCTNYEIFNTALIFLNKNDCDGFYLPMDKKLTLKKFKKKEAVNVKIEENSDEEQSKPKKEKDIILTSVPLNANQVQTRNEFFEENGIKLNFLNKEREKKVMKIRIERNDENEKKQENEAEQVANDSPEEDEEVNDLFNMDEEDK